MNIWKQATLILVIVLAGTDPVTAQQQFYDSVDVDGVTRQYLIYLPANFDPAENMPVLFHFHGGGGSPEGAIQWESDNRPLADAERFIAVYPAALFYDGCTCWNNEGKYSNGIDELGFAAAMIDAMIVEYNADPDRMYASGFSLGGSMMWDLMCYMGDRFAAIGVVAANMWQWTYADCDPASPTGLIHVLGTNDFYAPYNGNQYSISVAIQNAYWVSVNGSETTAEETNLGGGVTRYLWPEGEGCHTVAHYRRQGGGHDWPSFATQAIWDYVSEFNAEGLITCTQTCPGDLNSDDIINVDDLLAVIAGWGGAGGDADGNGTTNVDDLLLVISEWGSECP